jgi:hypothetical protein
MIVEGSSLAPTSEEALRVDGPPVRDAGALLRVSSAYVDQRQDQEDHLGTVRS